MRLSRIHLAALAFLLTRAGQLHAQADLSADLEKIRGEFHLPGISAMAFKGGQVLAQGAAGVREEGQSAPLAIDDPVNIGSCTKWMTATIAGRLVDRGVISWTTRIRDVFEVSDNYQPAFREATLEQLLAHRAGVEDGLAWEKAHWPAFQNQAGTLPQLRQAVVDSALCDPPAVPPGEFLYSNQGYTVAAAMLERKSGRSWEALIQDEVFSPLGMKSARLGVTYDGGHPPAAPVGHALGADGVAKPLPAPSEARLLHYRASNAAGGFVVCTLRDWIRFLTIQEADHPEYLKAETRRKLQTPFAGAEGYALGIGVVNRPWALPGPALNHSGDIFGEGAVTWMAPAKGFIMVAFVNARSEGPEVAKALDAAASRLVHDYADAATPGASSSSASTR